MARYERVDLPSLGAPRALETLSGGDLAVPHAQDSNPAEPEVED